MEGREMSEAKTKEELVRLAWLAALRRQGDRQCTGTYAEDGMVCALGLLAEITKADGYFDEVGLGAVAGLSSQQSFEVVARNDGGAHPMLDPDEMFIPHTFGQIADVVEKWFE
jgi:hypothetical protein